MQIGIAGYRGSGKTTVFNCLTGARAATGLGGGRDAHRAVVKVPDERVDRLSEIYQPRKTTHADIVFVDLPGPAERPDGAPSGVDAATAAELRRLDALVHVVRGFGAEAGTEPRGGRVDPARDLVDFDTELALLDLVTLEGRIDRLRKEGRKGLELDTLSRLRDAMQDGERPLRTVPIEAPALPMLSGFGLLSPKPQLTLLSLPDDAPSEATRAAEAELAELGAPRRIGVMALRPNIEREILELSPDEQAAFLADLGVAETARARFIRSSYALSDLISFFTVGEDEVRAWTIRRGTPAVHAAGKIHSDLERGFIRAETVRYEDFIAHGKMSKVREAGKLRLEGKDYVVADGDILTIRFNV
jgi:GTP-binding protein YchF